jgi:hypothetical protein
MPRHKIRCVSLSGATIWFATKMEAAEWVAKKLAEWIDERTIRLLVPRKTSKAGLRQRGLPEWCIRLYPERTVQGGLPSLGTH